MLSSLRPVRLFFLQLYFLNRPSSSHCATHQIRVILISCVVITSLFYPALAIYSSSQPLSLSLFDAFAARNVASGFHVYNDVSNLWFGHDHLKLHEDAVSRVKCSAGRTLRVEQLLIQSPSMDDAGAANHRLLRFVLSLEKRLNSDLSAGDHPCLKRTDGQCFVISPLLFWDHNEDSLLADKDVLNTLNNLKNVTVDGITITPQMVLAGRTSREHRVAASTFDSAAFLVMTYFFPESDCLSTSEHASWKQSVQSTVSHHDAQITFHPQGPALIALEVCITNHCALRFYQSYCSLIQVVHEARMGPAWLRLSTWPIFVFSSTSHGPFAEWMRSTRVW